jgi:catechol 2,3-dioxygenase-like lactoylglutathione lyase family enzyme
MQKVLGIGGVFFRSRDPSALAAWYATHLGIDPVPTGDGAEPWQQAAGPTAFSPFPADSSYFGRPEQSFMLNFRVADMVAMVAQLRGAGIEVSFDPAATEYGLFARLHDPEGNPIELWQE